MLWLTRIKLRAQAIGRRSKLEKELSQELEFHLAQQKDEYVSAGMSETEAEFAARRLFGEAALLAEQCRDQRRTRWLEDFASDTRFALRSLLRTPGFTLAAVLTLALGVGANLAFFSTAYTVLFRPLPYPDPAHLVEVEAGIIGVGPTTALRELATTANYAGYLSNVDINVQLERESIRVRSAVATWNLAHVLGIHPMLGRWFESRDERPGQHRVTVISHQMWRERFNADPQIAGRQILLNEEPYEIVGVMPARFSFPSPGTELWTPIRLDSSNRGYMWGNLNLWPIGRLRTGASIETCQSELQSITNRVRTMFPWRMPDAWGTSSHLVLHSQALVADSQPKLLALAAASMLLLLIACANVANLLLTRLIRRNREFALKEALGAGRGRLLRQVFTENLILAVLGGSAGIAAAWLLLESLPRLLGELPRIEEVSIDPRAAAAAFLTMLITLTVLGLSPSLRRTTIARRSTRTSLALAGLQLALATMLLIGAGLMGRTIWQFANVNSGVHAANVITGLVSAGPSRCTTPDQCRAFLQDLNATLTAIPGVQSVNWSNQTPLIKKTSAMSVAVQDHPRPVEAPAFVMWHVTASPGYFEALGIHLKAGRLFSSADHNGTLPVAIISESTARKFWPTGSAIGKQIRPVSGKAGRTVIGVVTEVAHYSLAGYPSWIDGVQYVPLEQSLPAPGAVVQLSVFLRGAALQPSTIHNAVRQRYSDVVVSGLQSLDSIRDTSVADHRSNLWLLSLLAALGLLLGIVGVHGVLTQRFAQRMHEIGIRMALGATARQVAAVVFREALFIAIAGSAFGIFGAFGLTRFLRALLFGVAEHDTIAFLAAPAFLIATALAAASIPALRAARLDPVTILKEE